VVLLLMVVVECFDDVVEDVDMDQGDEVAVRVRACTHTHTHTHTHTRGWLIAADLGQSTHAA
jgi:hypothetical protein